MGLGGEASGSFRDATKLGPIAAIVPLGYRADTLKATAVPGQSNGATGIIIHSPSFYASL